MRSIEVPFIPGLADMSMEDILSVMETRARRGYIDNANWPEDFPYKPIAVFDIARCEEHIFISYFVKGLDLKALFGRSNEPVWQDSCVEFFVKDPAAPFYFNFEFNCIGTCLASRKRGPIETEPLGPEDIAKIIRHTSLPPTPFREKEGMFEWKVVVGIPYELFAVDGANIPPVLRANFFKCGDNTSHPHYLSWNPIEFHKPNFHLPEFFGQLLLG